MFEIALLILVSDLVLEMINLGRDLSVGYINRTWLHLYLFKRHKRLFCYKSRLWVSYGHLNLRCAVVLVTIQLILRLEILLSLSQTRQNSAIIRKKTLCRLLTYLMLLGIVRCVIDVWINYLLCVSLF